MTKPPDPEIDRHALLRTAAAALPGPTARLDAELLLAHALGEDRLAMLAGTAPVDPMARVRFESTIERRQTCEPVAYILGHREFWSLDLLVTPDVLIPRADSETLLELALETGLEPRSILDLGTGSGALLLAALSQWPDARGVGIDRSVPALGVARANAWRLGMASRAALIAGDWATAIDARFDLILCNPPYIAAQEELAPDVARFEPESALRAGPDGLACYRAVLPDIGRLLTSGGAAIFEVGRGQAAAVSAMAATLGFEVRCRSDLSGIDRAIMVRSPA